MKFQKGRSGNPAGRPKKGQALTDLLRQRIEDKEAGVSRKEKIIEKLIGMAESGDIAAVKYIFDRLDGRPIEAIKIDPNGIDGKLLEILSYGKP